jgi:Peptidase MA superfamily
MGAVRRLAAVIAGAFLALLVFAPAVAAADPIFGKATATETFLTSITVEQQATLPNGVHRLEAYVRTGTGDVTFLADLPDPGAGDHLLRYVHPTPSGAMYPNTQVQLGFRVTLDGGRVVDSPPARILYEDTRYAWNSLDGDVVRVHWYAGNDAFGQRALRIGDKAIKDASALLGVNETDPIDYFVYADTDAFYSVLGPAIRENVGGIALPEIRTLFANIPPSDANASWVGIVVPHELTHLVFATATGNPYHEPPHWMNEGLAVYLSEGYSGDARADVQRTVRAGAIMPLGALVGQFPTTSERFALAYDESVSAIDYLVRTYGREALVKLIRSYADGVSDDAAFQSALGVDTTGFETGWLSDLGLDEPVPFGPRPAPVGPLPPDWAAAPASSGAPAPTFQSSGRPNEDSPGTPVLIAILGLSAVLLVLGLFVVARGLSRGQPLLAPTRPRSDLDDEQPANDARPTEDTEQADEPEVGEDDNRA